METFSALLALCAGNSPSNSPHEGQWHGALMFCLICAWINGWVNNREAGDLRRHRAHYDVTVMLHQKLMLANSKSNIYFDMQERWSLQLMTYNFAAFMCMAALSEAAFISVIFIYTFLYLYIRLCAVWFEMLLLGLKHFLNISCVEWRIFLFNVEQATRGVLKNTPRHGNGFRVTPRFTFKALWSGLLKKLHIDIHVS